MVRAHLTDVFRQDRPVRGAVDGQGGNPRSYEPVGTIRGRVSGNSAAERERGGREEAFYSHTVFAEPDTDLQRGDKLTRESDGLVLYVFVVRHLSGRRPHVEAACEETKPGR